MKDLKSQVDSDVINFFKQIEHQNDNDRMETLRNLLNKYIHLSRCSYMMGMPELNEIISRSAEKMAQLTFPIHLGPNKSQVLQEHQHVFAIAESTVDFLHNRECLKKNPIFDKRSR